MKRLLLAVALLAMGVPLAVTGGPASAAPWVGLRAGVAAVDMSWHVGASAGQYADDASIESEWDPNLQHVAKNAGYGIQSRLSTRALVVEGSDGTRIALVKVDNYLAQDYLQRRVGQLLDESGTSGVTYERLLLSATHDHSSPYYSTPSYGVWVFEDVMDLRAFEYQARQIAAAIEQAAAALRPVRMGATTVQFSAMQSNIVGPSLGDDGSPAGYPRDVNDHGLVVMRFDDMTDPAHPKPYATWMNFAEHPEELDGYSLVSADFLGPLERHIQRETGSMLIFTQGSVGSAEGPYEGHFPQGLITLLEDGTYKAYAHAGYAQLERGARLMADAVKSGFNLIGAGKAQVNWVTDVPVRMMTFFTPGPLSHPYPGVSNCRTETTLDGSIGVPVLGLPDCFRDLPEMPDGALSPLYDNLVGLGIPLPANYDATSFAGVEENLRLKLQAVRIGEVLLASCACEPQSDLILNLESRTDKKQGNIFDGYDYAPTCKPAGGDYDCADPRDFFKKKRITVTKAAYDRMVAQVHNDAVGWDDPAYALEANSEPADPTQIKGNFTKTELPADLGYALPVGLGHSSDYNGYTVSYREYQNRDSYRKALTSYGPHTADFMNTRLMRMAAYLKGGPEPLPEPTDPLGIADEQRQVAASTALGILSNYYYEGWALIQNDDIGPVAPLVQPKPITRFDGASFTWRGGGNYVDNPTARVERLVDGKWTPYADMSGQVQTFLTTPAPIETIVTARLGGLEWVWTAQFEAFDAFPKSAQPGGQVPNGSYRFVVDGHSQAGGTIAPYHLESARFTVSSWRGLTTADPKLEPGGAVSVVVPPVAYPRTYVPAAANKVIKDDGRGLPICHTCTFMPWASTSSLEQIQVTVVRDGKVVRVLPTTFRNGGWWAQAHLAPGELAFVRAGGVTDEFGETNGKPSRAVDSAGKLHPAPAVSGTVGLSPVEGPLPATGGAGAAGLALAVSRKVQLRS